MQHREIMAQTYLKMLFQPEPHSKLTHETKAQILWELRSMGLIAEGIITIPDSWWKEVLQVPLGEGKP